MYLIKDWSQFPNDIFNKILQKTSFSYFSSLWKEYIQKSSFQNCFLLLLIFIIQISKREIYNLGVNVSRYLQILVLIKYISGIVNYSNNGPEIMNNFESIILLQRFRFEWINSIDYFQKKIINFWQ